MKELTRRLLENSYGSYTDDSMEEDIPMNLEPTEIECVQIRVQVNRLQARFLCKDISKTLDKYVDNKKKLSRRRHQDIVALQTIISQDYETKEECILAIQPRLNQIKTGWFIFKIKSQLKSEVMDVIHIYNSDAVMMLSHELMTEISQYRILAHKYDAIRGDDIKELKLELTRTNEELDSLRKQYEVLLKAHHAKPRETSTTGQSLSSRLKGFWGK